LIVPGELLVATSGATQNLKDDDVWQELTQIVLTGLMPKPTKPPPPARDIPNSDDSLSFPALHSALGVIDVLILPLALYTSGRN
jgi:hypothetical protein